MIHRNSIIRALMFLAAGAVLGSLITMRLSKPPLVHFSGTVTSDSLSYRDSYLNNMSYLACKVCPHERIYLRFRDIELRNSVIRKNASLSGNLTSVKLESGERITQLNVKTGSLSTKFPR